MAIQNKKDKALVKALKMMGKMIDKQTDRIDILSRKIDLILKRLLG